MARIHKLTVPATLLAALLAVIMLLPQGCGKKEGGEELSLGVALELTGPLSRLGQRSKNGMDLAVGEINSSGGISGRPVILVVEDTQSDPNQGVSAFLKLTNQHKVPVVVGMTGSSIVMASAPVAEEKRVVLFSSGATSPLITDAGDYVFRNRLSGRAEVMAMAEFATRKLSLQRIAVLYVNTDYGVGNKDVFRLAFEDFGGKVLFSEGFDQGATDFRTSLTKISDLDVDGIYIIAVGENGYILKQAKELGMELPFLSTVGIEGQDVLNIAGEAANGVIYTVQRYDPDTNRKARDFRDRYRRTYSEEPDLFAALGYDAVYIIAEAIEKNGYTAKGIRDGLYSMSGFRGVIGPVSFDSHGDIVGEVMMKIIQNGQFVVYRP